MDSTDLQRKLAAGQGQLAQGTVAALRVSEWASLLLHPGVQAYPELDTRLSLSLITAGHPDVTTEKVCNRGAHTPFRGGTRGVHRVYL